MLPSVGIGGGKAVASMVYCNLGWEVGGSVRMSTVVKGKVKELSGLVFHSSLLVCIHLSVVAYIASSLARADFNQVTAELLEEVGLSVIEGALVEALSPSTLLTVW